MISYDEYCKMVHEYCDLMIASAAVLKRDDLPKQERFRQHLELKDRSIALKKVADEAAKSLEPPQEPED